MRKHEISICYIEFDDLNELPAIDRTLVEAARRAAEKAYSPYSGFNVGAALLLENGETVTGSNQENADFTDGICAERVAMFYANSMYPDVAVKSIAVTASNSHGLVEEPAQPCGSCRQVLVETEFRYKKTLRIILDGKKGIRVFEGADALLPMAFKPFVLK